MMNLLQKPQIELKQKCVELIDAFIDAIADMRDFLLYRHVTISEAILIGLALFRAVWFSIFGVENANYSLFFPDWVWITVFWTVTLTHVAGFFKGLEIHIKRFCIKPIHFRIAAAYIHAVVWGFLTVVAGYSGTNAPAVPTLIILFLLSFAMVIRLTREQAKYEC